MQREFSEKDLLAPELERLKAQALAFGNVPLGPVIIRIGQLAAAMAERGYALQSVALKGRHYHELEQDRRHIEREGNAVRILGTRDRADPAVRRGAELPVLRTHPRDGLAAR